MTLKFSLHPIAAAIALMSLQPAHAQSALADAAEIATASDVTQLPEVTVQGSARDDTYQPDTSTVGAKTPTAVRDIPQTVNIVGRALLDAQNATTLTDALRNVPGITLTAGEGGQIGDNANLRGFTARTDIYLDGMRDRGQYKRDTFALDSVEVLKGPSSLYFGRGSTGGVINQVSKTPMQKPLDQVSLSLGTDAYYRTTADFNQPLSDHAAYRVALIYQDVDSTREVVNNKDWGVAPSLHTALNESTDLLISGLVQHNRDVPDYGIPFVLGKPANVANTRYYGDTDDYFNQDTYVGRMRLDHRFLPWLSLRNQLQAAQTQLHARPTPYRVCTTGFDNAGTAPTGPCPTTIPIQVQSDRRDRDIKDSSVFDQLDLIASFNTGSVQHQMVGGAEIGRDETYNQGYTWPRVLQGLDSFTPQPTAPGATRTIAATHTEGNANTLGIYLNDTLTLSPQWKLVAGVRRDRFEATSRAITNATGAVASTTIPPPPGSPPGTPATTGPNAFVRTDYGTSVRGGLIWQPGAEQSYYVAYGTSFNPSAEALTISAAQSAVPPEKTRSYEIGGKWELAEGNLALSSALFRVDKADARTTDATAANSVSLDGDTRAQGFELGAIGRITPQWQVVAGYTLLDSELVKTRDALITTTGPTTSTTAVPVQGNELANTPRHSGSLWSSYKFLEYFEAGGGAYYVGRRYVTNADATSVDGYWRVDGSFAFHQPRYDLQLNLQNLLDADYYDAIVPSENGRAVPGRGRTAIVTCTYRFKDH